MLLPENINSVKAVSLNDYAGVNYWLEYYLQNNWLIIGLGHVMVYGIDFSCLPQWNYNCIRMSKYSIFSQNEL